MPLVSGLRSTAGPACHSGTFEGLKPFHPALMKLAGSSKQQAAQASKAQAWSLWYCWDRSGFMLP